MGIANTHYDASYFAWQRSGGELSASLDRWKFEPYVRSDDVALDFGCGGGYLLASLRCGKRYGIEVNPVARAEAAQRLTVFSSIDEIPAGFMVDIIISHHALEHVDDPASTLRCLRRLLKPTGRIVLVVPSESWWSARRFEESDINKHLYTWAPLHLGNLMARCGFQVEEATSLCHRWLPKARVTSKILPRPVFGVAARFWSAITFSRQVRVVARNSSSDCAG